MENNNIQKETDYSKILNYRAHAGQLFIPVIDGLEIQETENPQYILLAKGEGIIEQVVSDGHCEEPEFETRISAIINDAKKYMAENNCENIDESIYFYRDYSNGIFNYKLFIQDVVMNIDGQKRVTRLMNAYFIEPRMKDLYQVSLSSGPFEMEKENISLGVLDLENDELAQTLNNLMLFVLDNLIYS